MKKKGFTIVELLMVIGIISILITMTVSAVSNSFKQSRHQRASALCALARQGIETYYAKYGEWPEDPGEPQGDSEVYTYTGPQVQKMFQTMLGKAKSKQPVLVMDVSGLFVSTTTGERGTKGSGMDFLSAIRGTKQHPNKIKLAQMYFGYQDPATGYFRRFNVTYNPKTDTVAVTQLGQ